MNFKNILNKGTTFVQNRVQSIKKTIDDKKANAAEYDLLKTRSEKLGPFTPYEAHNASPCEGREELILRSCLTINVEQAKLVNNLLPIDETLLAACTAKEGMSEIEYILVATDKRLWVLNKKEYMTIEYENIKECSLIDKRVMSQAVKFDDKAFIIDGKVEDVLSFFEILKSPLSREAKIKEKCAYLMGVVPKKQLINKYLCGITIGDEGIVVLHSKGKNDMINTADVTCVQILMNDAVCFSKGIEANTSFLSSPMEARKMGVKVITKDREYTIEVLPANAMGTSYKREDSIYIKNYEFAKIIVDSLLK